MENQTVSVRKPRIKKNVPTISKHGKTLGRPRLRPPSAEPEETPALPDEAVAVDEETEEELETPDTSDAVDEVFGEETPPEETQVGNILSFLDGLDGGFEHAVTMHVYRYPTNKPEPLLTRDDRIRVGTIILNPATWEDDVHAALPKGGYAFIEFRWNQDVWVGDIRVKKAGTPAKGIYRRFDPLPFSLDPVAPQHGSIPVAAPTTDFGQMRREAMREVREDLRDQLSLFKEMLQFNGGSSNAVAQQQPPAPTVNPRIEALENKILDLGFEALAGGGSAPVTERARASSIYDIGIALVNRIPEPVWIQLATSLATPPGMNIQPTPQPQADATSPAIEPGAQDAKIVRHPIPDNADFITKYKRITVILYEDLVGNQPVTDTVDEMKLIFEQHPEQKGVFEIVKGFSVDQLKSELFKAFPQTQEQTALKSCAHIDTWLGELKKSLSQ